jgi:tetratricopeptide (TPR) repeat protein
MSNLRDFHNLPITTDSDVAAEAFNRTIASYLKYRIDTPDHLKATQEADPEFALAHCCRGYFTLLTYKQANVAAAKQAHQAASETLQGASAREHAHVTALGNWMAGDLDRTIAIWEEILADHPTDVLAMRLAHFNNFWLDGRKQCVKSIERIERHWDASLPGYGTLSRSAFAHEECGDYETAERHGRAAIEIDAADVWATHAVAHVFEMQGRRDEGIAWLGQLEPNWTSAHNIVHHLWWHRALLHLEQSEIDAVLDLYDRHFRNLAAPLVVAQPDLYIDIQNAASMLFRLERHGVDVGDR